MNKKLCINGVDNCSFTMLILLILSTDLVKLARKDDLFLSTISTISYIKGNSLLKPEIFYKQFSCASCIL